MGRKQITTHTDRFGYEQTAVRDGGKFDEKSQNNVAVARFGREMSDLNDSQCEQVNRILTLRDGNEAVYEARRQKLENYSGAHLQAVVYNDTLDPRSYDGIDEWHEMSFQTGEYNAPNGAYPVMGEDYTPNQTPGFSEQGLRRTHRMSYQIGKGKGATHLRMPSRTAAKRYTEELREAGYSGTFDMPVEVELPSGERYFGHVRVTEGKDDVWAVDVPGSDPRSANYGRDEAIAESVNRVLESRTPRSLKAQKAVEVKDRLRRAREAGVHIQPAKRSRWIEGVGHNEQQKLLVVALPARGKDANGKPNIKNYAYDLGRDKKGRFTSKQRQQEIIERMSTSPSSTYNAMRGDLRRVADVKECSTCNAVYRGKEKHTCRVQRGGSNHTTRGKAIAAARAYGQITPELAKANDIAQRNLTRSSVSRS